MSFWQHIVLWLGICLATIIPKNSIKPLNNLMFKDVLERLAYKWWFFRKSQCFPQIAASVVVHVVSIGWQSSALNSHLQDKTFLALDRNCLEILPNLLEQCTFCRRIHLEMSKWPSLSRRPYRNQAVYAVADPREYEVLWISTRACVRPTLELFTCSEFQHVSSFPSVRCCLP